MWGMLKKKSKIPAKFLTWLITAKQLEETKFQSPTAYKTEDQSILSNCRIIHPCFSPIQGQTTMKRMYPLAPKSSPQTANTKQSTSPELGQGGGGDEEQKKEDPGNGWTRDWMPEVVH